MIGKENSLKEKEYRIRHAVTDFVEMQAELNYYRKREMDLAGDYEDFNKANKYIKKQEEMGKVPVAERTEGPLGAQPKENVASIRDALNENKAMIERIEQRKTTLEAQCGLLGAALTYLEYEGKDPNIKLEKDDCVYVEEGSWVKKLAEKQGKINGEINSVLNYLEGKNLVDKKSREMMQMLRQYQAGRKSSLKEALITAEAMSKYDREFYSGISAWVSEYCIRREEKGIEVCQRFQQAVAESGQEDRVESELKEEREKEALESPEEKNRRSKFAAILYEAMGYSAGEIKETFHRAKGILSNNLLQNPQGKAVEATETCYFEAKRLSKCAKKAKIRAISESYAIANELDKFKQIIKDGIGPKGVKTLEFLQRKQEYDMHDCNRKASKVKFFQKKAIKLCGDAKLAYQKKPDYHERGSVETEINADISTKIEKADKTFAKMYSCTWDTARALSRLSKTNDTILETKSNFYEQIEKMRVDPKSLCLVPKVTGQTMPASVSQPQQKKMVMH